MFTQEEAQFQIAPQTAFGVVGTSGELIPGEASWNVQKTRNTLDNAQVQNDGFEREHALGNHISRAGGNIIYNLNVLGRRLKALCDTLTSAAFSGVYSVTVTNGGSGYTSNPTVALTGGDGTGATAVSVVLGGSVIAVVITNPGTGFSATPPTVGFSGGAGTGAAGTAVLDATKYKHTGVLKTGAPLYHTIEKGIVGQTLFRYYMNQVLRKLSFSDQTEGICSMNEEWVGSGRKTNSTTSIDATPTEITGTPGEYANLFLLEGGAVTGILTELSTDIECSVKEKRPPSYLGEATELRRGGWTVRGTGKAYFESEALATKMENGTHTSLRLVITSPDGVFTRLYPEVKFEFSNDWERSDEGIVIPVTFRSIKKLDASAPVAFTLINGTSGY